MPEDTPAVETPTVDAPSYDSVFDDAFPSSEAEDSSSSGTVDEPKGEAKTDTESGKDEGKAPVGNAEEELDPISAQEESEELKNAWKLPTVGKELRKAYYLSKEYQKLYPTVDEARAYRDLFATTDDAKAVVAQARALRAFDAMWSSGDPQQYEKILTGMKATDAKLFETFSTSFPNIHYKLDPEGYRKDTQMRFADTLGNFRLLAEKTQDAELTAALDLLAEVAFGTKALPKRPSAVPDDKDKQIEELKRQISERQNGEQAQRFEAFFDHTDKAVAVEVRKGIAQRVDALVPKESISDKTRERIVDDIFNEVDSKLKGNQELVDLLRASLQEGNMDKAHFNKVFRIVLSRAEAIVPEITRNNVKSWTQDILRLNHNDIEKARAASVRREPGGGGGGGNAPQISVKEVKEMGNLSTAYDKLMGY